MVKKSTTIAVFLYALVIIFLALLAFSNKGSIPSLLSGTVSGGLLLACSYFMYRGKMAAERMALALTALLTFVFIYRYSVSSATIPALLALLSGAMLIILLTQSIRWKR